MESEKNTDIVVKEIDLTGGIIPKNFRELWRFAELLHKSGLAPKSFDSIEKISIGILTNIELGRPVIVGLQDLAVINGKCGIYGDGKLAMVTASGLMEEGYPKETETGTPYTDDWTFTCIIKRKGQPERTGIWTWADSKRAGFDTCDKHLPWKRFTRRMMQWKARSYVYNDAFGDVIKGMKSVEELYDLDSIPLSEQPDGSFSPAAKATETKADMHAKEANQKFSELFSGEYLKEFVLAIAKANNVPIVKVKSDACKDAESFQKAFEKWLDVNIKTKSSERDLLIKEIRSYGGNIVEETQNQISIDTLRELRDTVKKLDDEDKHSTMEQPEAPEPEPEQVSEQTDTLEPKESPVKSLNPDKVDDLNEFKNLRSAGFSTWVYKNKKRIAASSTNIQLAIKDKWEMPKFYPNTPYPLPLANSDPKPTPDEDSERIEILAIKHLIKGYDDVIVKKVFADNQIGTPVTLDGWNNLFELVVAEFKRVNA